MIERTRVLVAGPGRLARLSPIDWRKWASMSSWWNRPPIARSDMRASTFHPPTLAMMEELGVLGELLDDGLKAPVYQYRNRRSGNVISLDMADIADMTPHPYRLQCEQYKLARMLTGRLANHPHGQVRVPASVAVLRPGWRRRDRACRRAAGD
ncbi:MAG: hypothetical protein U5M50_16190 [Sphingobium sp.]|nr:hypothetical protein [Sphingobium sp.]